MATKDFTIFDGTLDPLQNENVLVIEVVDSADNLATYKFVFYRHEAPFTPQRVLQAIQVQGKGAV